MIIDSHIHMYPPQVYADPVAWARHMDEPYWGALMGDNPIGTTIQGWVTVEQLITDMDAVGIDKVVMQGIYFRHHQTCVAQNNAQCLLRYGGSALTVPARCLPSSSGYCGRTQDSFRI
jgi:predicted TIM-barrel fold metal-dependent hydrolase